jgi:hypothetical protein
LLVIDCEERTRSNKQREISEFEERAIEITRDLERYLRYDGIKAVRAGEQGEAGPADFV